MEIGMGIELDIVKLKDGKVVIMDNYIENGYWNRKRQVNFY